MVSINTNLSSLIVQGNLTNSTNGLNKAVERLSTGYKINHAGDNAANYSIANKYEAKLSSYDVAADNITMGMDLLSVAQDTISTMQNHGARLQALITQARNGTYGVQSLNALTQEAGAIISEIQRMYTNTQYNNINLFDNSPLPEWAKTVKEEAGNITIKENGFIANITKVTPDVVVSEASELAGAILTKAKIGIANADVLAELATLVNSGTTCAGKTIILTDDINLSDYQSGEGWTAIGTSSNAFNGTFDGQGHKITGLVINKSSTNYQGLFGNLTTEGNIKNVELVDVDIKGNGYVGGLAGTITGKIDNCIISGKVQGADTYVGGAVGYIASNSGRISNTHSSAQVNGTSSNVGGLVGRSYGVIQNCFTTGEVYSSSYFVGGLVGTANSGASITNCYATGNVKGSNYVGGLAGSSVVTVTKCYATGDVTATSTGDSRVGGLIGSKSGNGLSKCYATGNIKGGNSTGGLIGRNESDISECFATGRVNGTSFTGGIVGKLIKTSETVNINKVFSSCEINATNKFGSFIGGINNTSNGSSFGTINITNAKIIKQDMDVIGFEGTEGGTAYESGQMASWLENIKEVAKPETNLQVGIMGNEASRISFDTGFEYDLSSILSDISSDKAYSTITKFMSSLSAKATVLGAASNRLESALDSVLVNMENLTSSLSTVKDVDMAQESSQYIRMQILQQASATLLATANQSPSIALQLI